MAWKNVQYENGKFKTGPGGGGGASALTDLDDVSISSASNGQVLKYNSTSSKWENASESQTVLTAYGQIVKSANYNNISAVGGVTVNLSGNLAEIDFCFQVTSAGGSYDDFEWGLSVDKIRELNANIPNLKPIQGGNFFCTQSNQSSLVGYGSLMSPSVPDYKYWIPARIYTVNGDIGGWPSSELYLGGYWFGRCYAEIL